MTGWTELLEFLLFFGGCVAVILLGVLGIVAIDALADRWDR